MSAPHVRLSEIMLRVHLAGLARLPWTLGKHGRVRCNAGPHWAAPVASCKPCTCARLKDSVNEAKFLVTCPF